MAAQDNRNQYNKARQEVIIPFLVVLLIQSLILLATTSTAIRVFSDFQESAVGPPVLVTILVLIFPISLICSIVSSVFSLLKKNESYR